MDAGQLEWLERLGRDLALEHDAFAVILYGSHARGAARQESDVDVLILVPPDDRAGRPSRDVRKVRRPDGHEVDLDGWLRVVDPADPVAAFDLRADPGHLCLLGGRALFDPGAVVPPILGELERVHGEGPAPVPDDEREAIRVWSARMLRRIAAPKEGRAAIAAWRRAELFTVLLPEAFRLRRWWYPGPERAFAELDRLDPALARCFAVALEPDATLTDLEALTSLVVGGSEGAKGS